VLAEGAGHVSQRNLFISVFDGNAGGKMTKMLEMCFEKHVVVTM